MSFFTHRNSLLYAIRETSARNVTSLIDRGANVNTSDSQGRTALMYGVILDRESIVALLIDGGADVNTSDSQGRTVLMHGVILDRESIVALLIDGGADVNTSDSQGRTALMHGVKHNRESIVALLIDRGADVNTSDSQGRTALLHGVKYNRESIVALLIDRGADVNTSDSQGITALLHDVKHNRESIVALLIDRGADINRSDSQGRTALIQGVKYNRESIVALLIDRGADVNTSDSQGRTALMYSVINNSDSIFALLIDRGADVNTSDSQGITALMHGVKHNRESTVALLIDRGADVNTSDSQGRTALMHGVKYNRESIVALLIDRGVDVNTSDSQGRTALMYSVINNSDSIVALLIDRGADVNTSDSQGRKALMHGVKYNRESIVALLIDRGANVNTSDSEGITALMHGVKHNRESIVALLIDRGADVNTSDSKGRTALMIGVLYKKKSTVALLIDRGANVNTSDGEGRTALMHGVKYNRESTVALLIARGADVNITDNEGKTALMYAAEYRSTRVVVQLIEAGADVNLTDNERKTALFYGVGDENIVRALIEQGNAVIDKRDQYGRSSLFYAFTKYSFTSAHYLIDKGINLQMKDNGNLSILSFYVEHFIDEPCLNNVNPGLIVKGLNVFEEHGVKKKTIFEALINFMLCKTFLSVTLHFKKENNLKKTIKFSCDLAKKYLRIIDFKKKKVVQGSWKIINQSEDFTHIEIPKLLEFLCELGANPNYADLEGNTLLHYATCLPLADVSQDIVMKIYHQLEDLGLSFNTKNHQNETPLLYCLSNKEWITSFQAIDKIKLLVFVCKFLLEHGASVEETTRSGKSIFHFLLEMFQNVLHLSACTIRKDILSELLKLLQLFSSPVVAIGVTVNKRDVNLNSPLHLWASLEFELTLDNDGSDDHNSFEKELLKTVLRHLMDCGAQLDDKNKNGETPLHLCRTWTAVKLLIDAGAHPNVVDSVGRTPLLVASKNTEFTQVDRFYPDVLQEPKAFWKSAIESRLDPWAVDKSGESVLSVLIKSEAFVLTKALVELACEENYIQSDPIAVLLLIAICRDGSTRTQWKSILVEKILKSRKVPIRYENNKDTPLHFCCKNIARMKKEFFSDLEEIQKTSVHWTIAKRLVIYGANCNVIDASGQSCLDIAQACPALEDLLRQPLNIHEVPLVLPWTSISLKYKHILAKVARGQECKEVGSFWFHQNKIQKGSAGLVFVGLNEKDGREVAIKRIEKQRILRPEADKKEITHLTLLADCEQVVRYLSFTEDEHFSYIILELMEGNLENYLSGAFDVNRSITLCGDVVKGLKYLHEKNILHRDLKPTNILYKTYPKLCLKIADFGLSRQIDNTSSTSGSIAGTRCWIAPEVLMSTSQKHSLASDVFSCGLVLHYVLSVKRHPFFPVDYAKKSELQISNETEANVLTDNLAGWDNCLCPEATDLVKGMLNSDDSKRPKAAEAIAHPLFWSEKKKMDLLIAVGNQSEFQCPRAKRKSLTAVEIDLDNSFRSIVTHATWNDKAYTHMPDIYKEMETWRKYDTKSVVELVRFIRNTHEHVSDDKRPQEISELVLKDFVFLEYFPKLVMKVFNCVKTHGWDSRGEIKYALD